jgi:hypothetical protein
LFCPSFNAVPRQGENVAPAARCSMLMFPDRNLTCGGREIRGALTATKADASGLVLVARIQVSCFCKTWAVRPKRRANPLGLSWAFSGLSVGLETLPSLFHILCIQNEYFPRCFVSLHRTAILPPVRYVYCVLFWCHGCVASTCRTRSRTTWTTRTTTTSCCRTRVG